MLDSLWKFARSNALGLIAIYIALAGSAFAVHTAAKRETAPKNSVVTKSIKRGAVTSPKLRKNSVTGKKVRTDADQLTPRVPTEVLRNG